MHVIRPIQICQSIYLPLNRGFKAITVKPLHLATSERASSMPLSWVTMEVEKVYILADIEEAEDAEGEVYEAKEVIVAAPVMYEVMIIFNM